MTVSRCTPPKTPRQFTPIVLAFKEKLQLRDANELLREAILWIRKIVTHPGKRPASDYGPPPGIIDLSLRHLRGPSNQLGLSK